jgi:hypothetical protein
MSLPPNLNLITPVLPVDRRDMQLVDPTILNPNATNPLVDGEWLSMSSSAYQVQRGTGEEASISWPVFSLRGQYDTQAIQKTTLLWLGVYEAETAIVNLSGLAVGNFLVVADVTVGGLTKRGLIKAVGAGQHYVAGIVTKLPGGGKVRFIHTGGFQITI